MRIQTGVAALAALLCLGSCGGGGSSGGSTPETPVVGVAAPTPIATAPVTTPTTTPTTPGTTPTKAPTATPSSTPTAVPTTPATTAPTAAPTVAPTAAPTSSTVVVANATSSPVALTDNPEIAIGDPSTFSAQGATTNTPIDGIACGGVPEDPPLHFHDHLSLYVNGKQYAIPAAIGIYHPLREFGTAPLGWFNFNPSDPTACHYGIHVHAPDGVIHIENEITTATFTLKDFLDIWGIAISPTGFMGFSGPTHWYLTNELNPYPYGNRPVTDITAVDPATITLTSHLEFTVEVGTPVNTPNYHWYEGL